MKQFAPRIVLLGLLWISIQAVGALAQPAAITPSRLRCEYRENPAGVDTPRPQLGWILECTRPGARGLKQAAYQVLVATTPELLGADKPDQWDSGKTVSSAMNCIAYDGKPLLSDGTYWWKVRVWDQDGAASTWSEPGSWTMGLLAPGDWKAKWIAAEIQPKPVSGERQFIGYHAGETRDENEVKWVQADLGKPVPVSTFVLHPMRHAGRDGFGFPVRFRIEMGNDPDFKNATVIADHGKEDFPNPGHTPVSIDAKGLPARFIRVTATRLYKRDASTYVFALNQLEAVSNGRDAALGAPVQAKDSVENFGWGRAGLTEAGEKAAPPTAKYETVLLRREFEIKPGLKRAILHVCGLGQYEMSLNGAKAGADLLSPGWTNYRKTCLYDTYDVTAMLRTGRNVAGIFLGNGMYNVHGGRYTKFTGSFGPLKAIALIRMDYADGTTEWLSTDENWRVLPGPITFSSPYGGEDYDARLEQKGWSEPDFPSDGAWKPAIVTDGPGGALKGLSCAAPPIRAFEGLRPVATKELKPGVTVYDLGQNAAIMPRVTLSGPAGSSVRIIPSELVNSTGDINDTMCGGNSCWTWTLAGNGRETRFPKFFYRGARYLKVVCNPPAAGGLLPVVESIEGVVVRSDCAPLGRFSCSNDLFNRINTLILWAQKSNMFSVLTDCPHREKLGWLEEAHLNGPSLRYNFDLSLLSAKIMNDMADSQIDSGLVPNIAPEYTVFGGSKRNAFGDSPEWSSAFLLVAWQQFEFTGDTGLLRRYYEAMKKYAAYLDSRAKDCIVAYGLGDWYDIGPKPPGTAQLTPVSLTATAFYFADTEVLAKAARLLGNAEEAKKYEAGADLIRLAFNKTLYRPDTGNYATGSQTANSIPLVMGLAVPENRQTVLDNLVKNVQEEGLTAGDVGYRYLLRALEEGGRSDVIFTMNNQSEKPGYGYQLKMGATSLTEAWDARRSSSQNHFMLGQIMEWFYRGLAGIQNDPAGPGFEMIIIKPAIVGDLAWVKAGYDSVRGDIVSEWKRTGQRLAMRVVIPANTTATVFVPATDAASVTESGRPADHVPGVHFLRMESGAAVYEAGSGTYDFASSISK
jgi:hypothetical protein